MTDGVLDLLQVAAPEPVVVGQGREEALTGAAEAVAGGAIGLERDLAAGNGELPQLRIGLDLGARPAAMRSIHCAWAALRRCHPLLEIDALVVLSRPPR